MNVNNDVLNKIEKKIELWKKEKYIPREGWKILGENGLIGVSTDKEGLGRFQNICSELIKANDFGLLASYSINEITYRTLFKLLESDNPILKKIEQGEKNVALCITEENAGSDIRNIETEAQYQKGIYIINGQKILVSNGPIADYFIIAVKTNKENLSLRGISLFLLDKDIEGIYVSDNIEKAGADLLPIGEVHLTDCSVSEKNILCKKNRGFQYLMDILQFERIIISITATIASGMLIERVIPYINSKYIFKKKLADYQNIKIKIAEYYSQIMLIREYVNKIVRDFDNDKIDKTSVMIAKSYSTELLKELTCFISQIYGGKGFLSNHWISNIYNDIRWTSIAGGPNELIKEIIGNIVVNGGR